MCNAVEQAQVPVAMTAKNAAKHFGLPYRYILNLIHDGEVEYFDTGKSYYVVLASVARLVRSGTSN